MTQAELADLTKLTRETISRIESGLSQPRPDTMGEILSILELDMQTLAVRGRDGRPARTARYFDGSSRGEYRHFMGRMIRAERLAEHKSLRAVADKAELSASQLSRIERGEGDRSAAYADDLTAKRVPKAQRRTTLVNPELCRLAEVGFALVNPDLEDEVVQGAATARAAVAD